MYFFSKLSLKFLIDFDRNPTCLPVLAPLVLPVWVTDDSRKYHESNQNRKIYRTKAWKCNPGKWSFCVKLSREWQRNCKRVVYTKHVCTYLRVRTLTHNEGNAIGVYAGCIYVVYRTTVYITYLCERIISRGGILSESFKGRGSSGWKTAREQKSDAEP